MMIWNANVREMGPILAVALHDGHTVRPSLLPLFGMDEAARLREEDPFTGVWTDIADISICGTRSRFEVDLNRARHEAVYLKPEDAWGLPVWKDGLLPVAEYEASLAEYDSFYAMLLKLLKQVEQEFGRFFVFDLHAYNHRRNGPNGAVALADENPEVNIGTGTMNRQRWAPLVDGLMDGLSSFDFMGRQLDVRENVKFMGRGFPRFVHEHFPLTGCAVAIEFKKFWMDEWTGEMDVAQHAAIRKALASTVPMIRQMLDSPFTIDS